MLIIFGGLPGTGKTTISQRIATHLNAVYLRIDTVEQTLKRTAGLKGPEGYMVCYEIAKDNLCLGNTVVADSVNPIEITRRAWQSVAQEASAQTIEIELMCSDKAEHQNRVESRKADIQGLNLPTWQDVLNRDYEPWDTKSITIDTSKHSIDEVVQKVLHFIGPNKS